MKTIILDIETWTPDWNEGENGWEEGSFAPTAFHEPVVISWMVAETVRTGGKITDYNLYQKSARMDEAEEADVMLEFRADIIGADRLVIWNGRGFDMPVLSCRAMHHGIDWSWWLAWRHRFENYKKALKHYDLMDQLGDFGAARGFRQDRIAKLCGLEGKTDIDGRQVHALWASGIHRARVQKYCDQDVIDLWRIYLRYGRVFFGLTAEAVEIAEKATRELLG